MINLYKVEYMVIQTGQEWKANIVSESRESVEKFLNLYLKTPIILKSVSSEIVVNGITDDIVEKIKIKYKDDIINEYIRNEKSKYIEDSDILKDNTKQEKPKKSTPKKKSLRKK